MRRVVERVLAQSCEVPFELVVADTESSDGTREYLSSVADRDPRLRWFSIPKASFGHGRTRNELVAAGKGEFVAFLTQDALPVNTHWLDRLTRPLRQSEQVAGVTGRHLAYPEHGPVQARNMEAHFARFGNEPALYRIDDPDRYAREASYRQLLHFYSDNNSALRRTVWEAIPYPDVPFGEDQLWAEAILKAGYAKAWSPDATVYHSHRYGFSETLARAREEALYYHEVFGYRLGNALWPSLKAAWKQVRNDWKWMRANGGIPRGERRAVAVDTFGLYLGHWKARREMGRSPE